MLMYISLISITWFIFLVHKTIHDKHRARLAARVTRLGCARAYVWILRACSMSGYIVLANRTMCWLLVVWCDVSSCQGPREYTDRCRQDGGKFRQTNLSIFYFNDLLILIIIWTPQNWLEQKARKLMVFLNSYVKELINDNWKILDDSVWLFSSRLYRMCLLWSKNEEWCYISSALDGENTAHESALF